MLMSARVADMRKSSIGYTVLSYGGVDRDYARMDNNLLAQFIYMAWQSGSFALSFEPQ